MVEHFSQKHANDLLELIKEQRPPWYILEKNLVRDDVYEGCQKLLYPKLDVHDWEQFWEIMGPRICVPIQKGSYVFNDHRYIQLKDLWEEINDESKTQELERAEFLLGKLCYSKFCDNCKHELVFMKMGTWNNWDDECERDRFVTAWPEDRDLGEIFHCVECDCEQYRCGECFTIGEDLCHECFEEQEKEFVEEYKCVYCLEPNTNTHWCGECDQQACDEHSIKCDGCSLTVCFVCHHDGKGCRDTHDPTVG